MEGNYGNRNKTMHFFLVIGIIAITAFCINEKDKSYVLNNSPIIAAILRLNDRFVFSEIASEYRFEERCRSLQAYDRAEMDKIFFKQISLDVRKYEEILNSIEDNTEKYKLYLVECEKIMSSDLSAEFYKRKGNRFKRIEEEKCKAIMLKPTTDALFNVSVSYKSPGGRNYYHKEKAFSCTDLSECINQIYFLEEKKSTKENQRLLMTKSLRYDVLKRDGFKCVLCGATASDGVKLHVDHIIPIAKGGKTELSNLRTLCENCNLGKRDKYDPSGVN